MKVNLGVLAALCISASLSLASGEDIGLEGNAISNNIEVEKGEDNAAINQVDARATEEPQKAPQPAESGRDLKDEVVENGGQVHERPGRQRTEDLPTGPDSADFEGQDFGVESSSDWEASMDALMKELDAESEEKRRNGFRSTFSDSYDSYGDSSEAGSGWEGPIKSEL